MRSVFRCFIHRSYDVGRTVEWEINTSIMSSSATVDNEACIDIYWNKRNTFICRVKAHPSNNPRWQEITGFLRLPQHGEQSLPHFTTW